MPGQASFQSTQALTAATMPYLKRMAKEGIEAIAKADPGFAMGINCSKGKIRYKPVAEGLGLMARYEPI
jgi:alanine dehydrogenase